MQRSILVIICFFGRFPWYFRYFLHSCTYNPSIDFIIFSDAGWEEQLPGNVVIVQKTIADIKRLASEKLGFEVNLEFPYKFCDFKPAYGLIFSEYAAGYDFWAQSDIDIIYGNLRKFLTGEFLDGYDFISLRHDYTTGCFALYRNDHLMNTLFKRSRDFVKVFSGSPHFCFDECNFAWDDLADGKSIFDVATEIESFTHLIRWAESRGEIRAHFDFILLEGLPGRIRFDRGSIIYKNAFEVVLYHLYWLKRVFTPPPAPKAALPDVYFISPSKIYFK